MSSKVQLFKHTVLQIYTLSAWFDAICKVDKTVSGPHLSVGSLITML